MANTPALRRSTWQPLKGKPDTRLVQTTPVTAGAPWWLVSVLSGVSVGSVIISGWIWALALQQ